MSGKPQFDEAAVIAAAIGVFRRHGYAAASISDLTEATGLSRSSLYQRFRDKDGLFQEALAAYTRARLAAHELGQGRHRARAIGSVVARVFAGRIISDRGLPDRAKLCRNLRTIRGGTSRRAGRRKRQREILADVCAPAWRRASWPKMPISMLWRGTISLCCRPY